MSNPDEIKLEPCPFCGSEVETIDPIGIAVFHKDNPKCPLFKIGVNIMGWNTRPIETKLQAEIAKREAAWGELWKENERLKHHNEMLEMRADNAISKLEKASECVSDARFVILCVSAENPTGKKLADKFLVDWKDTE